MATVEVELPTLETGDNLTRDEFLRTWEQLPHIKYAELIGGIVYMPAALGTDHGGDDFKITTWDHLKEYFEELLHRPVRSIRRRRLLFRSR